MNENKTLYADSFRSQLLLYVFLYLFWWAGRGSSPYNYVIMIVLCVHFIAIFAKMKSKIKCFFLVIHIPQWLNEINFDSSSYYLSVYAFLLFDSRNFVCKLMVGDLRSVSFFNFNQICWTENIHQFYLFLPPSTVPPSQKKPTNRIDSPSIAHIYTPNANVHV